MTIKNKQHIIRLLKENNLYSLIKEKYTINHILISYKNCYVTLNSVLFGNSSEKTYNTSTIDNCFFKIQIKIVDNARSNDRVFRYNIIKCIFGNDVDYYRVVDVEDMLLTYYSINDIDDLLTRFFIDSLKINLNLESWVSGLNHQIANLTTS